MGQFTRRWISRILELLPMFLVKTAPIMTIAHTTEYGQNANKQTKMVLIPLNPKHILLNLCNKTFVENIYV
jgi:cell division protein FtsW (lipid II flippase)